jgi:VIT1/CCC1 family predicted Fe2+/Mn2+ transporter
MIRNYLYRYLDPLDRMTEIIYGVLIVMTFTMAFRAFDSNLVPSAVAAESVNRLFIAAFGCTVAWGLIDGVISVLTSVAERAEKQRMIKAIRRAPDEQTALAAVADELDSTLEPVTGDVERQELYRVVLSRLRDNEPKVEGVERDDIYAALGLVILAIVATLPVVIPLLFIKDPFVALRASNLIAITMLFIAGYLWARHAGVNRLKSGLLLAGIGVVMVLVAIPLGG